MASWRGMNRNHSVELAAETKSYCRKFCVCFIKLQGFQMYIITFASKRDNMDLFMGKLILPEHWRVRLCPDSFYHNVWRSTACSSKWGYGAKSIDTPSKIIQMKHFLPRKGSKFQLITILLICTKLMNTHSVFIKKWRQTNTPQQLFLLVHISLLLISANDVNTWQ